MVVSVLEELVGEELERVLESKGVSNAEVEKRAGLPRGTVEPVLRGTQSLDLALLHRILAAVHLDSAPFLSRVLAAGGAPVEPAEARRGDVEVARQQVARALDQVQACLSGVGDDGDAVDEDDVESLL